MNKHTPGPWMAGNGKKGTPAKASVYAKIGDIQVKIAWCDATLGFPHCVVNARLIAAAPDLLDALKEMLPGAEAMGWNTEKARAAIAKAEDA